MFGRLFGKRPASDAEVERLRSQAATAAADGRGADARSALERAVTLAPERADLLVELGERCLADGDAARAAAVFAAARAVARGAEATLRAQWGAAAARARLAPVTDAAPGPARAVPRDAPLVSVVICSIDPLRFERVVANFRARLGPVRHEIVGIHDARSLCEGYNRGIANSRGEVIVFAHDDIRIVSPDFAAKLFAGLAEADILGVAGTTLLCSPVWGRAGWPHLAGQVAHPDAGGRPVVTLYGLQAPLVPEVQALDGLFFAARRAALERVRFDAETFDGWHFYDLDFTFSAYLAGLRLAVRADLLVWHDSPGRYDERWQRYAERFVHKHRADLTLWGGEAAGSNKVRVAMPAEAEWIALAGHLWD